jgi:hypothetical protein
MTPSREAIVLPGLFLTVTLLGGLRIADTVRLLPPSLTALVLAVLLLGVLARGGVLLPHALMNPSRTAFENLSGGVVLLTVFAASAQAVNLLLPERGLLHAAFAIFLFCQIMTMHAAGVTRSGTLRSVLVLLGSMFVLRHIVVEALYAPNGGLLQRVLTTLMSGATLGGIAYDANAPVTGYVAFFTLVIYVVGLLLLPTAPPTTALVPRSHGQEPAFPPILLLVLLSLVGCRASPAADTRADGSAAPAGRAPSGLVSAEQRMDALRRADVWQQPAVPVGRANLRANPAYAGAFKESDEVHCRLVVKPMNGTTPKFDCEIGNGDVVRVKYGRGNPELYAEVATTRLLSALGFGADRVYVVRKVACAGCNAFPFQALRCLAETGVEHACFPGGVNHSQTTEFADVVVERRLEGRRIEAAENQGWAWYELKHVDAAAGGASRAEVDALELMAVLLAHWDNKAENQRLICLPGGDLPDGGCSRPFAILQDVGASFGPVKLDLQNWRALPVWADAKTCLVSMAKLPWGGGTFPEQHISEEGRRFLLRLLEQLSAAQIEDLFAGSGIDRLEVVTAEGRQPAAWAAAFQDKVRQIREAGPCR